MSSKGNTKQGSQELFVSFGFCQVFFCFWPGGQRTCFDTTPNGFHQLFFWPQTMPTNEATKSQGSAFGLNPILLGGKGSNQKVEPGKTKLDTPGRPFVANPRRLLASEWPRLKKYLQAMFGIPSEPKNPMLTSLLLACFVFLAVFFITFLGSVHSPNS